MPSGDTRFSFCLPFQLFSCLLPSPSSFFGFVSIPSPSLLLWPHTILTWEATSHCFCFSYLTATHSSIFLPPLPFHSLFSYLHLSLAFLYLPLKQEAGKRLAGPLCARPQFVLSQADTALKSMPGFLAQ